MSTDPFAQHEPYQLLPQLSVEEYADLRADIERRGMLVPVEVCGETGFVLDGHHRVRVAEELGLESYPRIIRAGWTHEQKEEHALTLNLARRHLTRAQRQDLVVALRKRKWSLRRIARVVGVTAPTVLSDLRRSDVQDLTPDDEVVGADGRVYPSHRKDTSVLVTTRDQQESAMHAFEVLGDRAPGRMTELRRLERVAREEESRVSREAATRERVVLPDGVDVRHSRMQDLGLPRGSVDLVCTDPPYLREAVDEGLWGDLATFAYDALKPGGLLVTMAPTMWLPEVMRDLTASRASRLEFVWMLVVTFPHHPLYVHRKGLASAYRPVLVFRRPGGTNHKVPGWTRDVLDGSGRAKDFGHDWQQSAGELEPLLKAWTKPGDLVADPLCGTGTTGVAALAAGCRFVGCDEDAEWVAVARKRLAAVVAEANPEPAT